MIDTNQGISSNAWEKQAHSLLAQVFAKLKTKTIKASEDRAHGLLFLPLAYFRIHKSTEKFWAAFH